MMGRVDGVRRVRVRRLMKGPPCQARALALTPPPPVMGKKSRRAKKWFGRGGHQRYAGRPVDLNTTTKESEARGFAATARDPDAFLLNEQAGMSTRALEETLRQRRIVSVAGRFKGGGAPGGSGAKIQGHRIKPSKMELTDETRPRAISAALANVKAAFDAIPPHQHWSDYGDVICAAM